MCYIAITKAVFGSKKRRERIDMNNKNKSPLFGLIGNLLVFALVFYMYFQDGKMTPVYIGLLVINAVLFFINLMGFFAARK